MKKLIYSSVLNMALAFNFSSVAFAEVVDGEGEETLQSTAEPAECSIRVTGDYNIRVGPAKSEMRCTGFEEPFNYTVNPEAISTSGDWVQFTSAQTVNCPGGKGWAHRKAFNVDDLANFKSGKCGAPITVPDPANQPDDDDTDTSVQSTNSRGHIFPLPQCLGLKNDGGLGKYGSPRQGHRHGGTDYYSPKGTHVSSPCNGKVISRSVRHRGSAVGNALTIKCDNGDQFKMFHLNDTPRHAAQGERLTKGELVGGVGNTGNANGQAPHLHLEAVIKGKRVDPQTLFKCGGDSGH